MKKKLKQGQTTLDIPVVSNVDIFSKPPQKVHKLKVFKPLPLVEKPSVTLHKGGGKIVITANDIQAGVLLLEIRERLARPPVIEKDGTQYDARLLADLTPADFAKAKCCWSLVADRESHPMVRILKRYGLEIKFSPTLDNWLKKEERRLTRELTPFLLPDYKDERPLFEKVEAGMVLACKKTYTIDKTIIFTQGQRYQVVDTARGSGQEEEKSQDGIVKISKIAISPGAKITLDEETCFAWSPFTGDMEDYFHYDEKIIYEPKKCIPAKYPELLDMYKNKLESMGLELYDHVKQDAIQEAIKRCTLNGKLMRMGKTSESIVVALLWGSKRVSIISPRNARIFTVKEFVRLGITDYVVVNSLADFDKPAKYYLLTYSWLKKATDPHRKFRRQGQSYLQRTYTEKKQRLAVEHKCPFCSRTLERLCIEKIKSEETGFLLSKEISWTNEGGYICRNAKCKAQVDNSKKVGAAWSQEVNPKTGKIKKAEVIKLGSAITNMPTEDGKSNSSHIGYIDFGLLFHNGQGTRKGCKDDSIQGRYCHECKQADAVWTPGMYRQRVVKPGRNKKVHIKDFFTANIVDEIHTIKTESSDVGKAVRAVRAKRRMGLTGTLMPNTPADAYWPLHYVFKGGSAQFPFHQKEGADSFYDGFCEYIMVKRGKGLKDSKKMLPYLKNPIKFWELMSSKMVRRNYEDQLVKDSLAKAGKYYPNIIFHRVESEMVPEQAAIMVAAINNFEQNFNTYLKASQISGHLLNQAIVISQMSYLRIGATCPEYFNVRMDKLKKPHIYHGAAGGGKMIDIHNIVATKTAAGEKVVILSEFVEMRKVLAKELVQYNPIIFNGAWDDEEREENFDAFMKDGSRKVFVAGTRQVREGTNLAAANTVICCDLLWEPGLQQQAWSRAFTPTDQARTCEVYMLMSKHSIDEHIYNTFYAKVAAAEQALDRKVINKRAHQVDLRWFVDRVLSDRDGLLSMLEDRGQGIYIPETTFKEIEDRDV